MFDCSLCKDHTKEAGQRVIFIDVKEHPVPYDPCHMRIVKFSLMTML